MPEENLSQPEASRITYAIQGENGGPVKIGRSTDGLLDGRLAGLQGGNPRWLVVVGVLEGDREMELHRRFRDERLRRNGEWFRPCEEMLDVFPNLRLVDETENQVVNVAEWGRGYELGYIDGLKSARQLVVDVFQRFGPTFGELVEDLAEDARRERMRRVQGLREVLNDHRG